MKVKKVAQKRPAGQPVPGHQITIKKQKLDTSEIGITSPRLTRQRQVHPNKVGLGHDPKRLPYDLAADVEIVRVMADAFTDYKGKPSTGLLGHIMQVHWWTKSAPRKDGGVKVTMKSYNNPNGLTIEVDGKEVFKWVQDNADLPTKFTSFLEDEMYVGAAFIKANELKPGDEVVDLGDGTIDIVRAEDEDEDFILDDDEEDIEWL